MPLLPIEFDETTAKVLTSSDDLDNITQIGNYTWSSSSLPDHAPLSSNAIMNVNKYSSTDGYVLQTAFAPSRIAIRFGNGTSWGSWYTYFDKNKIRDNLRSTFIPLSISMTNNLTSGATITLLRGGSTINLRTPFAIPAATYTCNVLYSTYPNRRYLRLAYDTHANIKTFFRNCGGSTVSIDDFSVGSTIGIGASVVVDSSGSYYSQSSLFLVRDSSTQWSLAHGSFYSEASGYSLTVPNTRRILAGTGICTNTILFNDYDTIWS